MEEALKKDPKEKKNQWQTIEINIKEGKISINNINNINIRDKDVQTFCLNKTLIEHFFDLLDEYTRSITSTPLAITYKNTQQIQALHGNFADVLQLVEKSTIKFNLPELKPISIAIKQNPKLAMIVLGYILNPDLAIEGPRQNKKKKYEGPKIVELPSNNDNKTYLDAFKKWYTNDFANLLNDKNYSGKSLHDFKNDDDEIISIVNDDMEELIKKYSNVQDYTNYKKYKHDVNKNDKDNIEALKKHLQEFGENLPNYLLVEFVNWCKNIYEYNFLFENLTLLGEQSLANEMNPTKPTEYKNLDDIIGDINKSLSDEKFQVYNEDDPTLELDKRIKNIEEFLTGLKFEKKQNEDNNLPEIPQKIPKISPKLPTINTNNTPVPKIKEFLEPLKSQNKDISLIEFYNMFVSQEIYKNLKEYLESNEELKKRKQKLFINFNKIEETKEDEIKAIKEHNKGYLNASNFNKLKKLDITQTDEESLMKIYNVFMDFMKKKGFSDLIHTLNKEYKVLLKQLGIKPGPKPDDVEYENDIMTIQNYTIYKTIEELKIQFNDSKKIIQDLEKNKQELLNEKKEILEQDEETEKQQKELQAKIAQIQTQIDKNKKETIPLIQNYLKKFNLYEKLKNRQYISEEQNISNINDYVQTQFKNNQKLQETKNLFEEIEKIFLNDNDNNDSENIRSVCYTKYIKN